MTAVPLPTQAQVTRAVKAAMKGAHDMGYRIASYKVTFAQGIPSVEIVIGEPAKADAQPVTVEGIDVEAFREQIRTRYGRRS